MADQAASTMSLVVFVPISRQDFLMQTSTANRPHQSFCFDAPFRIIISRLRRRANPEGLVALHERINLCLGKTLNEHFDAAIGHPQDAHHHHHRTYAIEIVRFGVLDARIALSDDH